ncbi:MAG: hypothetical protein COT81_00410 [Candidatus Buchananbacteria bacterium CG10_big_fil_rev_8_21_14_0_10_42_9]|uniref:Uncharacterized protein n=1 Tax=Candidatus Buchananbacteria bacterium CG10_big_fil_rev_8_21_14_0_10_42_9 TaxID=1974526 RepID=A0A2H0W4U5_9BACT|nr:MAG: hypothetical protein COT81_00410 [Candidatus Buchananbacteria bacterium CG10_big_fil_rev_8_21_14_0_10_42_9]
MPEKRSPEIGADSPDARHVPIKTGDEFPTTELMALGVDHPLVEGLQKSKREEAAELVELFLEDLEIYFDDGDIENIDFKDTLKDCVLTLEAMLEQVETGQGELLSLEEKTNLSDMAQKASDKLTARILEFSGKSSLHDDLVQIKNLFDTIYSNVNLI